MFDRAAILREAHAAARRRRAPSHYRRPGDRYDAEMRAWVPAVAYRVTFARCLRETWHAHKHVAIEQAYEASLPPVPADVLAEAAALRAAAWGQRCTTKGDAAMIAQFAAASALIEAARFGAAS